ncbi:uncharacterized protein LOC112561590 isoform X3 [Pomacea canaliculata]|nr:uncharacterized protein LOC112561590 isoform X3 [Pomacea canaliculata]XP_025089941.1 uncharacterized protein LOC112561590 isoform X3 [Pomacea canaliculata]
MPTHNNPCCTTCTPHHSFPCKILFFLAILALDFADLISDWLLFVDVILTREGLVYGPPENAAIYALLAFSIVGTVTFIFEAVNLWWEVFRYNPWLDADLVSAVIIWIEDLPQIAINVYIAMCREDPISIFQLSKASVILIGILIRIIISSVKYCNKAALREAQLKTAESQRHVVFRVFIMSGLLINAACAITIFIFTQTQRDMNGKITFNVPTTLLEDQYNDQRYFQNVSVFIHHPDFDTGSLGPNNRANWVQLMTINKIRDQPDLDISYQYVYERDSSTLRMALWTMEEWKGKTGSSNWSLSECYNMSLASGRLSVVDNVTCASPTYFRQAQYVFITFSFTAPAAVFRRLIFGDIGVNLNIGQNGSCFEYDNITDDASKNMQIPSIHYYRINSTLMSTTSKHVVSENGISRFYRNDGVDLTDIREVWKTGWGGCESSGSMAPHLDRSISTPCGR